MLLTTDKEIRWKLFEGYAARFLYAASGMDGADAFALTPSEYSDFQYLKLFFVEDYVQARMKPWLPNFFTSK